VLSGGGKAREGRTSLASSYSAFIELVKGKLPPAAVMREHLSPTGSKFTIDLTMFAPHAHVSADAESKASEAQEPEPKDSAPAKSQSTKKAR
jgi:hypothetical protein